MAERDQFAGAFGRHDAGDARRAQHVALFGVAGEHELERLRAHHDAPLGDRDPLGRGFLRNIDHTGLPASADVRECFRHYSAADIRRSRASSALVAAETSFCRIRLSPIRKVDTPTFSRRPRSAGANSPLSPTTIYSFGTSGARRS